MKMNRGSWILTGALYLCCPLGSAQSRPSAPITLTVNTAARGYAIPPGFIGLGFETKSILPNAYAVRGYFFTLKNNQLITLFKNIGIKQIRVGGGTVDGSGSTERCNTPIPQHQDIDQLFEIAQAAGIQVIYSLRLLNVAACADPNLAEEDAATARYIWHRYRANLESFAIGNEPDVRSYHSYPGHIVDPKIYEAVPGIAGSAYPSYFADWQHFAKVILKAVPNAKFSGPDTAVSSNSSFTPNPTVGVSWTQKFSADMRGSGVLEEAVQHHYVWGSPGNTTAREAIDDMLSGDWDNQTAIRKQPAYQGGMANFHPYPYVYTNILAPAAADGVPYRMTEANDCLHGVTGASDGFASALWALDYMHWWAAHGMAGVNFHNNPWIPTDTIVPDPNPCPPTGCTNYRVTPKGYGMKAFDLGSHGYVEPIAISNPNHINLTAYAVGDTRNLYVTIINKTHTTTHDVTDAAVEIQAPGFAVMAASSMILTDGDPGNAARMTATLGGASIENDAPWQGKWIPLSNVVDGKIVVTVPSTTAVIVKIHAAAEPAEDQNGQAHIQ